MALLHSLRWYWPAIVIGAFFLSFAASTFVIIVLAFRQQDDDHHSSQEPKFDGFDEDNDIR